MAARILPLIDLTNLNDDCTPDDIDRLCEATRSNHGNVAAVCVWPRFVGQAVRNLQGTLIKVATVVNFPAGGTDARAVLAETKQVVADGANEVDLVMPYNALKDGDEETVRHIISIVRAATDNRAQLKVILETGELATPELIAGASGIALDENADFIKTSTGKVKVNATPEAAQIMLTELKRFGDPARGFKPAGGMKTVEDAAVYLDLADEIMGANWASAATMRFGASSLLGDVLAALSDEETVKGGDGDY